MGGIKGVGDVTDSLKYMSAITSDRRTIDDKLYMSNTNVVVPQPNNNNVYH